MCFVSVCTALLRGRCRMKSGGSVQEGQTGVLMNLRAASLLSVSSAKTAQPTKFNISTYQRAFVCARRGRSAGIPFPQLSWRSFCSGRNFRLINRTHSPFNRSNR